MTKADHIRSLYDAGATVRDIAIRARCSDAYVRVVARQRTHTGNRAVARIAGRLAYQSELSIGYSRAERMRAMIEREIERNRNGQ